VIAAGLLFAGSACITFEVSRVEVTPEPVPADLEGARWDASFLEYCVHNPGEGYVEHGQFVRLVAEAFDRWGVATKDSGECPGTMRSGNRRNEIAWGALPQRDNDLHEAGLTEVLFETCGSRCPPGAPPEIVEADITISNDPPGRLRNRDCLFATLLHETGHFLGIAHLGQPAVMAPVSFDCPQRLTEADREALLRLYPSLSSYR
jgi:hypothetical protein